MALTQLFYDEKKGFRKDSPLGEIVKVEAVGNPCLVKFDTLNNDASRLGANAYCKTEFLPYNIKAIYQLYKI